MFVVHNQYSCVHYDRNVAGHLLYDCDMSKDPQAHHAPDSIVRN